MKTLATFSITGARALVFASVILLAVAINNTLAQESLLPERSADEVMQRTGPERLTESTISLTNQNQATATLQGLKSGPTFLFNVAGGDARIHGITAGRGSGAVETNTAFGLNALGSVVSGSRNVAIGYNSLENNTGQHNTSIGARSMQNNVTGSYNTSVGDLALSSLTAGSDNIAVGADAVESLTIGSFNIGIGSFSFFEMEEGFGNTALGFNAGRYESTIILKSAYSLFNSTFVGHDSGPEFPDMTNVTGIGYEARPFNDNQVMIGNTDVVEIGGYTFWTNFSVPIFLKSNLQENVAGLDFILRLRPVTYQLDAEMMISRKMERASVGRDGQKTNNQITDREIELLRKNAAITQSGFLPEEVLEAARETGYEFNGVSVSENESDHYGIRYGAFIMPIVKSIQELNNKIEEVLPENLEQLNLVLEAQHAEIEALRSRNDYLEQRINDIALFLENLGLDSDHENQGNPRFGNNRDRTVVASAQARARLEQNAPNPFHEQSVIRYFIPEEVSNARIVISDMQGNQVSTTTLHESGHGQLILSAGLLTSGTFIYTLYIDGRPADSKRMVIL